MSKILIAEKPRARGTTSTADSGSVERTFDIHGAANDLEAKMALYEWYVKNGDIPDGYSLNTVEVNEKIYAPHDKERNCYEGMIRFAPPPTRTSTLTSVYAYDVSTANFNLRHAYAQRQFTTAGEVASMYGTAINVEKKDGRLTTRGIDVPTPIGNLRITRQFPLEDMSTIAGKTHHKVGMVNSGTFNAGRGFVFEAEEVLFGGAQLAQISATHFSATYNFLVSPSDTNPSPINEISYPGKKGWEYLWCAYETVEDSSTGLPLLAQKAIAVFLARVYLRTSFSSIMD